MSAQPERATRRRRKPPQRRVPAVIEQRERKPLIFGWGADLSNREREAVKEKIALFAGIGLAIALAGLIGWGVWQDNVVRPAALRAANDKPIAKIGNFTITMGLFKRDEKFQQKQLQNALTQLQQQQASLQSNSKKNAATLAQIQQETSTVQQQLGTLASGTLSTLIDDQTVLQRSNTEGLPVTSKVTQAAMTNLEHQAGGQRHLLQFIQQSGLTESEFKWMITAEALQSKLQAKLAKKVSHWQTKVRASHILVKSKPLAEKLYHEALHGANFAALAKKYSTDPGSAKKGGDLGYFAHGQMVPQFDQAAFSMKAGQIKLVHSQYGWHVIKLTGRERARLNATDYAQAQQSALQTWLAKQQGILHLQRFVAVSSLPGASGAAASSLTNQVPSQLPSSQQPAVPALPKSVGKAPAITSKVKGKSTTSGKKSAPAKKP